MRQRLVSCMVKMQQASHEVPGFYSREAFKKLDNAVLKARRTRDRLALYRALAEFESDMRHRWQRLRTRDNAA